MASNAKVVLVTGATGYIGGALARTLLERGYTVRALGRNLERGVALGALGADYRPVDLCDRASMLRACEGVDAVIHAGALTSPWGTQQEFESINVGGTQNVIAGCVEHGVKRLVYVSSPSVTSRFCDQLGLTEAASVGPQFVAPYAQTKWEGELRVSWAAAQGLDTVIVRPRGVYGPGDTTIFPRIIRAAQKGALPVIGDGGALTNMTYIDDAVEGLCLALECAKARGKTYVLTGDEDVRAWDVIRDVLERLGIAHRPRTLSIGQAMAAAGAAESLWRISRLAGEPPLTRYSASLFAYSQTYDISAAKQDLGYAPKTRVSEGVERFVDWYRGQQKPAHVVSRPSAGTDCATTVSLELFSTGTCNAPSLAVWPDGGTSMVELPAIFGLIEHPSQGTVLFDTGYSERFFEATRSFPARIFRWITPATIDAETGALGRLRTHGVDPLAVRLILLSHFDPDHYGGLLDFPNARIACTQQAWASVRGKTGVEALRARILPGHLPDDLAARLVILPDFEGEAIGPFERSHDVFADGSIRLVELAGHAWGQFGAFVRRDQGDVVFLAADGCWSRRCLEHTVPRGQAHKMIAVDKRAQQQTYALLRRLAIEMPEIAIVPSHCPDAAAQFRVQH
ncbi:MAG: NAD-dependent epimerase/dehydratase family protein [Bradymonadaceae bacterium]|nr:NAD-dependent epimerase/dehydratase family protein [Lujinxingiaceae bacterium]